MANGRLEPVKFISWRTVSIGGIAAIGVCALVGNLAVELAFLFSGAASMLSILIGARRNHPNRPSAWYAMVAAMLGFSIAYALRIFFPSMQPQPDGSPTLAEFFDTAAFLTAIASGHQMAKVRDKDKDPTTVIDALVLAGGVSAVLWIAVMLPYIEDDSLALSGRILGVLIAAVSIWLAFVASRMVIGPGHRNSASVILCVAAVCGVSSQVVASAGFGALGIPVVALGACALTLVGAAALHPSMTLLTEPASRGIARMTIRRLVAMTLAVLIAPVLLVVEAASNPPSLMFSGGLIATWAIVTSLVMLRLMGLVQARERVASLERALSRAAASLVSATDRDGTYESALVGMMEVVGDSVGGVRASVALAEGDGWRVVGALGDDAESAQGHVIESGLMRHLLVTDDGPVQMSDSLPVDLPSKVMCSVVIAPLKSHGQVRGALLVTTATPLQSSIVDAVGALASDVSLAVEAVVLAEDLHRRRSEQQFKALVENSPDIILVLDADNNTTFVSPAAERLLGEGDWQTFVEMIHARDRDVVVRLVSDAQRQGQHARPVEFRVTTSNGELRWFEATAADLSDENDVRSVVLNASDISERKAAEVERELREARFRSLVQHSSDLTVVFDSTGVVTYITPAVETMLGHAPEALVGTDLSSIVHADDVYVIRELAGLLLTGSMTRKQVEMRVSNADGQWLTLEVMLTDLRHDESVGGIVMNAHDITERKALEHDLRHKVLHDDLTGIANRVLFRDRVEHAIVSQSSRSDRTTAVLFIDVDDFKTVNDGLGHDVGDEFLKVIAFRLESFVRSSDTAARLGGDEFGILFEDLYTTEDVMNASRRLLAILNQPIEFGRREIGVSASIGVAMVGDGVTAEVLLRNADVAMYHAKQNGKNRVTLFDESLYVSAFERLELKADLLHALERNELALHYQPLVKMSTGELMGFEALLRWTHPTRGFVSPVSFIPLAEETGMIVEIGAWVLNEALSQLAEWRAKYGHQVGMSINVSPRQLQEERIVDDVRSAITASGVDPSWVTLELTESAGLDDATRRDRLISLREIGCEIAADDFGTGFASYAALQQLPFTNVKIDRSLIIGLSSGDSKAQAQVRSIIQMGHALGLTITAEGIEDSRQADALSVMGADKAQGYLFGRPMPAADADELFRQDLPIV